MTKRVAILMLVLFGTVLGLIWLPTLTNREPKYQGKPLSHWFKKYYQARFGHFDELEDRRATRALCAMGTNAVPWLVAQALSTDQNSPLETNVLSFLGKHTPFFPPFVSADEIRWAAGGAIYEIKPPASLLLPLATNAFDSLDLNQRRTAIGILGAIGDGAGTAVPFLREQLRSGDLKQSRLAVGALKNFGPAARAALPDLIALLNDDGARILYYSIYSTLGSIGAAASNAIPILKQRIATDKNLWAKMDIATALWQIDSRESGALGLFSDQIRHTTDRDERWRIIKKFGEVGPNAKAAVPFLLELLNDPNQLTWHPAAESLLNIGETNLALAGALKKLNGEGFNNRLAATKLILGVQPTNTAAMATLVVLMKDGFSGYEAIRAAGNLGLDGKPAIPALREIANGEYPSHYRQAARQALRDIKAVSQEKGFAP